jgi:hypothetical protein
MANKHLHHIVVVTWLDAVSHPDGEQTPRHVPAEQVTIGWLLRDDKKGISLAGEYNKDGTGWRDENFIPRAIIKCVEYLTKR